VGISLGSTTSGGAVAVGVGNTLYGKPDERAHDPKDVKPYAAEGTAPPQRVSAQPKLLRLPEPQYPAAARKAGVEGDVVLLLRVDARGRVIAARVVSEPGAGTGEAARAALLHAEFSPALLDGEAVETEIRFTYHFDLE
jgi:protein TonB